MTEERKQELRLLLEKAMASLKIKTRFSNTPKLPAMEVDSYKWHLQQSWTSYSEHSLRMVNHYKLGIDSGIQSKLLEFMRKELDPFIHEDKILSATFYLFGGDRHGIPLDSFLEQLLRIAIVRGTEGAVSNFEKSTKETRGSFQAIALIKGIKLEAEIQAFEGIHLAPLPNSESKFPVHFGSIINPGSANSYLGKTVIVIDYSIFPIFHKPFSLAKTPGESDSYSIILPGVDSPLPNSTPVEWAKQREKFKVEIDGGKFPDFKEADFHNNFCQALSLACNSAVQVAMKWKFIAPDELFNVSNSRNSSYPNIFGDSIQVGEAQIEEARCLYKKLVETISSIAGKLQIPIERWIKSKANKDLIDKIIDLGIALEALYLSEGTREQLTLQFRLRASWHLGKDKEHRKKLIEEFKAIYDLRSQAVHSGKIPEKVKIRKGEEPTTTSEFIAKAQDLCRDSILKILEEGEFPDWNNLILG